MVRKLYLFSVEVYPPIVAWLKQVKCVITAICLDRDDDDPGWYNGSPYAVAECVFDENDQA
jgi:hypothetical protein